MNTKRFHIAASSLFIFVLIFACEILKRPAHAQPAAESVPKFERDLTWPKPLPNKWITGQIPGIAVDSHDHIWVIHRPKTIRDQEKGASYTLRLPSAAFPRPRFLNSTPRAT